MPTKSSKKYLTRFLGVGQIKVWSLVVTALGDLATEESAISGAQLNALFKAMQVKPEALRVALHRLSKEGWVISDRTGRTSDYRLSPNGIAETLKVWDRVYKPNHELDLQWHTIIVPNGLVNSHSATIKLAGQSYLVEESVLTENKDALSFSFQADLAPDWVEKKILEDGLNELANALVKALKYFRGFDSVNIDVEQVAIRILCLHHWRRIALRDASWLHLQHYENGCIRRCHDLTHQLLTDLSREAAREFIERYRP